MKKAGILTVVVLFLLPVVAFADTATVTVTPYTVTYDGAPHFATASAVGTSSENLSADVNLSTSTTHTAAGTYTADTWYFHDPSGAYTDQSGTITDTIAKAPLTITANSISKTYGDTVTFAGTEFGTTGLFSPDTATSVSLASGGADPTAFASPGSDPSALSEDYTIVPSGAAGSGLSNYVISYANGTLTVNKKVLTVTATANNKVYDGTNSATITGLTASGALFGDDIHPTVSAGNIKFSDANVGAGKTVTLTNISIGSSGSPIHKYTLAATTITVTANITPAPLTITVQPNTKTYDGTTAAAAVPVVSGLFAGDTASGLTEAYDTADAGSGKTLLVSGYTINDGNGGHNYTVATTSSGAGVITRAASPSISLAGLSQTYDGASKNVTVTTNPGGAAFALTYNGTSTAPVAAGSYAVSVIISSSTNYAGSSATGTLIITKADQSIGFSALGGKTFGDSDFAVTATTSSGLAATFAASGDCTVNATTVHLTGSGSCTVTASQGGDANYNAAADVSRTFAVVAAPAAPSSGGGGGGGGGGVLVTSNNAIIPQARAPSTQGEVLGTETYRFTKYSLKGSKGDAVLNLQKVLIAKKLLPADSTTGYFGALTLAALKQYQKQNHIAQTGTVGPLTRAALNKESF